MSLTAPLNSGFVCSAVAPPSVPAPLSSTHQRVSNAEAIKGLRPANRRAKLLLTRIPLRQPVGWTIIAGTCACQGILRQIFIVLLIGVTSYGSFSGVSGRAPLQKRQVVPAGYSVLIVASHVCYVKVLMRRHASSTIHTGERKCQYLAGCRSVIAREPTR